MVQLRHFSLDSKDSVEKLSEYLSLDGVRDGVFWDILKYLITYHKAKTVIIEDSYIDKNYSNEFSNLYSKTFQSRQGYCKRLHFFQETSLDLQFFLNQFNKDQFTYLGFVVNRPVTVGKVGSTIIKPKEIQNLNYVCSIKKKVHFLGKTLEIEGIPFIEQDGMVMTCAQASIWIISNYMHYTYGIPRFLPFDITKKATGIFPHLGRAVPSSGLSLEQMAVAVSNIECFPLFRYKPQKGDYGPEEDDATYKSEFSIWKAVEKIFPYIESSIPILIYSNNHVYTIIGYKYYDHICDIDIDKIVSDLLEQENIIKESKSDYIHTSIITSSTFIDSFIVHDDQQGIYKLLPTGNHPLEILQGNSTLSDLLYQETIYKNGGKIVDFKHSKKDIEAIIIPLPEKIYILADEVISIVKNLFSTDERKFSLLDVLIEQSDKGNQHADQLLSCSLISSRDPIFLTAFFINSNDFKASIHSHNGIHPIVKEHYLSMAMPLLIWVVKISYFSLFGDQRRFLGEILFDSTANKYDSYGSILSVHLPGYFYKNKILFDAEEVNTGIPLEEPYDISLLPHQKKIDRPLPKEDLAKKEDLANIENISTTTDVILTNNQKKLDHSFLKKIRSFFRSKERE